MVHAPTPAGPDPCSSRPAAEGARHGASGSNTTPTPILPPSTRRHGSILFLSLVFVLVNLLTDVIHAKVDPWVSYD
ncbi:MAG: hypothetical protein ACREL3_09815 [Gemmatimonadales bacterium]